MPTSFIVVDDFLSPADAQGLRQAALGLTYPVQDGAFPGRNSQQRLELDGLSGAVSRLVNEPLRPVNPLQSHGKFRLTLAGDTGRAKVHADHSHWSGILYLSAPEHCEGGTEFFRHRPPSAWPWMQRSWPHWAMPTAATCIVTSSSATATTTASGK
ncbi:hypothetical protein [Stenotrophomonas maltophilia]|uniref:hypothetical protein n=1 Tax=Stenotrophomonas maltophilia TaxID=40324 RepID=UPI001E29134D|nr:hypothetical protein [Stenotrophomonas maltophilia]